MLICSCVGCATTTDHDVAVGEAEEDAGAGDEEGVPGVGQAIRIDTVRIDCGSPGDPIGAVFRPGVQVHFFGPGIDRMFRQFLEDMRVGVVRIRIEGALRYSTSYAEFRQHVSDHDRRIRAVIDRGGQVIIQLHQMPRWLSSVRSEDPIPGRNDPRYLIAPPRDYALWEDVVYEVVKHFNRDLGLDLLYEIWNEPEFATMWSGNMEDYFKLYRHAVIGARGADPDARVGGPALGWWSSGYGLPGRLLEEQGKDALKQSILYQWLAYASSTALPEMKMDRLPVDFVSWHQYIDQTSYVGTPVKTIRDWLEEFGYGRDTPLIIDEWNSGGPRFHDPRRDTPYGAAFSAAMIVEMDRAGLDGHSFFELRSDWPEDPQFTGDLGLVTPIGIVKPAYNAFRLISMLDGRRLDTERSAESSLGIVASRNEEQICLLVVNFLTGDSPFREAGRFLTERGYQQEDLRRLGLTAKELHLIFQGRRNTDGLRLSPAEREDLDAAAALYEQVGELVSSSRTVVLEFVDVPYDSIVLCERYLIDEEHAGLHREQARIEKYLEGLKELSKEAALDYLRRRGYSAVELDRWRRDSQAAVDAYQQARGKRRQDLGAALELFREERRRRLAQGVREINQWDGVALKPEIERCRLIDRTVTIRVTLEPQAVSLISLRPVASRR